MIRAKVTARVKDKWLDLEFLGQGDTAMCSGIGEALVFTAYTTNTRSNEELSDVLLLACSVHYDSTAQEHM